MARNQVLLCALELPTPELQRQTSGKQASRWHIGADKPHRRVLQFRQQRQGSQSESDSRTIRWKEAGDEKAQTVEDEKRNFRSKCCACSLVAQAQDDHL